MMGEPIRLCRDCEHRDMFDKCQRPQGTDFSPLHGESICRLDVRCAAERASPRSLWGRVKCGPKGKFFSKLPPEPTLEEALKRALGR